MSLTAGAKLQNHKYAVDKQIHQSDFGVTYQAQHSILGRPVVLQTLNEALRHRDDFVQLRQQFLSRVRAISQQPVGNLHVLDCFEEDGLPFVVFELAPGQAPPHFSDWIPVLPDSDLVTPSAPDDLLETAPETLTAAPTADFYPVVAPAAAATTRVGPQTSVHAASQSHTANFASTSFASTASASTSVMQRPPMPLTPMAAPRRAWMPMTLIFLSMLGGLLGVGLGFSWRFSSIQATGKAGTAKPGSAPANLTPYLFGREQSFPSSSDWPVSEIPQMVTSDPAPIEDLNPSSPEPYQPPALPLPAEANLPAPPPVQPSPLSKVATPAPSADSSPIAPILPLSPDVSNAPSPSPAEIAPPVEAAPEPLPSLAPAPPSSPKPILELPPLRQPKVFRN